MCEQDIETRRALDLERYHRRVAERKARGLCLKCGKRPPEPHRSQCGDCAGIVDELGYIPLSQTGSELLFDVFSRRYENGATIVTSNLPFQEWTTVFASERLTGALLDRITHHVHILEMNGESYRLKQSRSRRRQPSE